jgi:hypothetical protein
MMGTLVRIGRPILIFCSGLAMSNFRQIDRGRCGQHVGGCRRRGAGAQRQAATCTDARQTIGFNGSSGRRRNAAGDSGYNRRHPPPARPPAAVPPARPSKKAPNRKFSPAHQSMPLGQCRSWVKLRRSQYEHMFSALPPNSDIARWQLTFRIRANT